MSNEPNPIPPIYGYIAQPRLDPSTGQTVYVAAGQPVLMPYVTPQGEHILVYQEVVIPDNKPEEDKPKVRQAGVIGAISNLGNSISKASSIISREFTNAWNNAFK